MVAVDVPSADIIITQTNLLLALIITIGTVVGLGFQFLRWINKRLSRSKEEQEEKRKHAVAEVKKYVDDQLKEFKDDYIAKANLILQKLDFVEKINDYIMEDVDRIEDRLGLSQKDREPTKKNRSAIR